MRSSRTRFNDISCFVYVIAPTDEQARSAEFSDFHDFKSLLSFIVACFNVNVCPWPLEPASQLVALQTIPIRVVLLVSIESSHLA
jgi:hypothetical protein